MKPNIFKLLEIETKENIHSSFIVSIVNSSEFAKKEFIKMLNNVSGKDFDDKNKKQKAKREKVLSSDKSARVDIYLTDYENKETTGNTRIIIENKIYAGD